MLQLICCLKYQYIVIIASFINCICIYSDNSKCCSEKFRYWKLLAVILPLLLSTFQHSLFFQVIFLALRHFYYFLYYKYSYITKKS